MATHSKTRVPLRLAELGNDVLISRSQARFALTRIKGFGEVVLDFAGIRTVGQAFADEVFRVFANAHPKTRLVSINTNDSIRAMIRRAMSARDQ